MIQRVLSTVEPSFHKFADKINLVSYHAHVSLLIIVDIDQDSTTNQTLCQINRIFRPPSTRPLIDIEHKN